MPVVFPLTVSACKLSSWHCPFISRFSYIVNADVKLLRFSIIFISIILYICHWKYEAGNIKSKAMILNVLSFCTLPPELYCTEYIDKRIQYMYCMHLYTICNVKTKFVFNAHWFHPQGKWYWNCATSLILHLPCRMRMLSGWDGRWTWMSGKGVAPPRNRIDLSIRLLQGANPFREIIRSRGPLIYCTRAKYTRGRGSLWTRSSLRDSDWTLSSSSEAPPLLPPPTREFPSDGPSSGQGPG